MVWIIFLILLAACVAVGSTGMLFPPGDWYKSLSKPSWTPPDWLFPVAWTALYICMSLAGALAAVEPGNAVAMALWGLQIALNGLWTPVFFGLHRIKLGLIIVAALWCAVAASVVALWQISWLAGLLFVPYLVWVTVATALNAAVLRLNPKEAERV